MILAATDRGSEELRILIRRYGVECQGQKLPYADLAFEGQGPRGQVTMGIERKRIRDLLDCIQNSRYNDQRRGMTRMYQQFNHLIVEGLWKPSEDGLLLQGIENKDYKTFWTPEWGPGMRRVMYATFRRFLFSVMHSGVLVMFTRDVKHTAFETAELYRYYQKPWHKHESQLAFHDTYQQIPTLDREPSLVRKWAYALDGIGMHHSADAERLFKTPYELATSQETDWMRIEGVGAPTAVDIIKQIEGRRR